MCAVVNIRIHYMKTLSARVDEELIRKIDELAKEEKVDRATIVRKLLSEAVERKLIEVSLEKYKKGKVSLWKAASLCGLSLWEFIDVLSKEGINIDYGIEELLEDIEPLRRKK